MESRVHYFVEQWRAVVDEKRDTPVEKKEKKEGEPTEHWEKSGVKNLVPTTNQHSSVRF